MTIRRRDDDHFAPLNQDNINGTVAEGEISFEITGTVARYLINLAFVNSIKVESYSDPTRQHGS